MGVRGCVVAASCHDDCWSLDLGCVLTEGICLKHDGGDVCSCGTTAVLAVKTNENRKTLSTSRVRAVATSVRIGTQQELDTVLS